MFEKILKFWFGDDLDSLKLDSYKHKPELWFKLNYETDQLIISEFANVLSQAENGLLDDWLAKTRGKLALIVLFDQFSRNIYRGTRDMFKNDDKCVKIANGLIENKEEIDSLSLVEKFFVYLPLLHSEDLETVKRSLELIQKLSEQCPREQKTQFLKYFISSKVHVDLLEKFGRYPHRNSLLNRTTTEEESQFLQSATHTFVRSVKKIEPKTPKQKTSVPPQIKNLPLQKILFLHGFRQNSNKIKKRLSKLVHTLKQTCNVNITFLNGTHPYRPVGEIADQMESTLGDDILNPIESQRVWFISDDQNQTYEGLEESLKHIEIHRRLNGPYDGIMGFGQGAVLASIYTKLNPKVFNYLINISAFEPRCSEYKDLFSPDRLFDFPSLHVYGKNDELITKNRSEELARCFRDPVLAEHSAGHFAPLAWPLEKIVEFITSQSKNLKPTEFDRNDDLEVKIKKLSEVLLRFKLENLNLEPLFSTKWGANFLNTPAFNVLDFNEDSFKTEDLQDRLIAVYLTFLKTKALESKLEETPKTRLILKIFLDILLETLLPVSVLDVFFKKSWKELVLICDMCHFDPRPDAKILFEYLLDRFSHQILLDLKFIDSKKRTFLIQELTSVIDFDTIPSEITDLARFLPRIKSSIDKRSRIGREIAVRLNPIKDPNWKILSYNHYRKCLTNICGFINESEKIIETKNPRHYFSLAKHDKKVLEKLLNSPLSDAILNPVPEPVDTSSYEQMKPLYDWLELNKKLSLNQEDLQFLRGTVTSDGRLDLCKQVIGPKGIKPLLESMENNKNIDRLLLGNNIIGDDGGKYISDFIKSGKSPLKIWYIAGNHLTHKGIKPIAEALSNDTQVNALWLKRNPLKAEGMIHIGNLMRVNTTIQTLDLLNCGLLDKGTEILMESLKDNNTLKHLYLSANGITPKGLESVKKYWSGCLETLFLGANRVGDEGAKIISDILRDDFKLKRLNLSSCRIGSDGVKYLVESLESNSSLACLDLGYLRASMDLGEIGNFMGDEGADYLSGLIEKTKSIVILNITHNHITQIGMKKIVESMKKNESIVSLDYVQFGVSLNEITLGDLRKKLSENKQKLIDKRQDDDFEELLIPKHVKEIYSVYRTH